jgi:hypothetical protein
MSTAAAIRRLDDLDAPMAIIHLRQMLFSITRRPSPLATLSMAQSNAPEHTAPRHRTRNLIGNRPSSPEAQLAGSGACM